MNRELFRHHQRHAFDFCNYIVSYRKLSISLKYDYAFLLHTVQCIGISFMYNIYMYIIYIILYNKSRVELKIYNLQTYFRGIVSRANNSGTLV